VRRGRGNIKKEERYLDDKRKWLLHVAGIDLELRVEIWRCGFCIPRNQSWNAGIRRRGVLESRAGRMYVSSHARETLRLPCLDWGDAEWEDFRSFMSRNAIRGNHSGRETKIDGLVCWDRR
jgi:hypothetical protein